MSNLPALMAAFSRAGPEGAVEPCTCVSELSDECFPPTIYDCCPCGIGNNYECSSNYDCDDGSGGTPVHPIQIAFTFSEENPYADTEFHLGRNCSSRVEWIAGDCYGEPCPCAEIDVITSCNPEESNMDVVCNDWVEGARPNTGEVGPPNYYPNNLGSRCQYCEAPKAPSPGPLIGSFCAPGQCIRCSNLQDCIDNSGCDDPGANCYAGSCSGADGCDQFSIGCNCDSRFPDGYSASPSDNTHTFFAQGSGTQTGTFYVKNCGGVGNDCFTSLEAVGCFRTTKTCYENLGVGFYKPGSCPGDEPIYVEPYASYHKATIDFSCGLGISADTGDLFNTPGITRLHGTRFDGNVTSHGSWDDLDHYEGLPYEEMIANSETLSRSPADGSGCAAFIPFIDSDGRMERRAIAIIRIYPGNSLISMLGQESCDFTSPGACCNCDGFRCPPYVEPFWRTPGIQKEYVFVGSINDPGNTGRGTVDYVLVGSVSLGNVYGELADGCQDRLVNTGPWDGGTEAASRLVNRTALHGDWTINPYWPQFYQCNNGTGVGASLFTGSFSVPMNKDDFLYQNGPPCEWCG